MSSSCCYYSFEFFAKGFQVKYDKDNNTITQYIPFAQILTFRNDYIFNDKASVITIILRDSVKYSYSFKGRENAEDIYKKILAYFQ